MVTLIKELYGAISPSYSLAFFLLFIGLFGIVYYFAATRDPIQDLTLTDKLHFYMKGCTFPILCINFLIVIFMLLSDKIFPRSDINIFFNKALILSILKSDHFLIINFIFSYHCLHSFCKYILRIELLGAIQRLIDSYKESIRNDNTIKQPSTSE